MGFSITNIIADPSGAVAALEWAYDNADGNVSNTLVLEQPKGDVEFSKVTKATALKWLGEQLGNTADDFDKAIAEAKQQREYEQGLKRYTPQAKGAPVEATDTPAD